MATDGKTIEDLSEEAQEQEFHLRYAGAVKTLSLYELRVAAARIVATYPQYSLQEFLREAESAFNEVLGGVISSARDAHHVEVAPASGAKVLDVSVMQFPARQRVRILHIFHFANIRTIGDLVKLSARDLLKLPKFERSMLISIEHDLAKRGLVLTPHPLDP